MDLETLKRTAREDLPVSDLEHIDQESFKNQMIKQKWLDFKADFELLLIKSKTDHQQMYREKWEYYGGKADAKVYASKPFDIKVMKTDLQMYIQSDDDILRLQNKMGYYESCVDYCKGVIKSIDNRGWDIRNATDWKKFEAGMILTIEPGIYIPGKGGIRIEDDVLPKGDKPIVLTKAKKELY